MASLVAQIAEVKREIAMRMSVYPHQVARGKMKQGEADIHIATMRGVLATLEWLQENEQTVRDAIAAKKAETPT